MVAATPNPARAPNGDEHVFPAIVPTARRRRLRRPASEKTAYGVAVTTLASEYAHGPTILATLALCVLFAALIGRWWTLILPVALIVAVLSAAFSSWYYERVPEDVQAGIALGAFCGLVLGAVVLLARRRIDRRRTNGGIG